MSVSKVETSASKKANEFLTKLRKKGNDEHRIKVAKQLYDFINSDLREHSAHYVNEFISTFDAKVDQSAVYELISSSDNDDKKAGILLIVCLVENAGDEQKRIPRFAKYLLKALTNSDEVGMKLSARAIAYLIQTSKTFAVELVEKSLNQVCEWLEEPERHEARRMAAVLLAGQLALYTSTSFFLRAAHFFSNIFNVIRDPKVQVRIYAAKALRAALAVTSQREAKQKSEWYRHCYEEAIACQAYEGLNRDERAHAMLLILNELLRIGNVNAEKRRIKSLNQEAILSNQRNVIDTNAIDWLCEDIYSNTVHSRTAKLLIAEKFEKIYEVCTRCMSTNRTVSCQIILLEILPRLLSFQNILEADNDNYEGCAVEPSSVFTYVLSLTNKHPQSLATLGLFILDKPQQLRARIPQLLGVIQQMLQSAINKRKASDENVFTCLTLVVRALDVSIENDIRNLLPLLFATGLSKGLIDVTYEIMVCIPSLKTDVQDGLLKELCQLLMNRKLPNKLDPPSSPPIPSGPVQVTNVAVTKLALAALAKFDFQRHALQMFIKYIAHGYVVCENAEVRLAAVKCCAEMLSPFVRVFEVVDRKQRADVLNLIQGVLRQLVSVAVVDSSVEVRLSVLRCFKNADHALLSHLAQADMLELIFMSLHDEKLEIQEEAVALLGKLGDLNPAFVLPRMRKILLETLSQLTNSRVGRLEEYSARLIAQIAHLSPKFMRPYMNPVLSALIPKLRSEIVHVDVTIQVLNAISELAISGGADLVRTIDTLFTPLLQFLQDSSSLSRREAALRTLGRLCQNTAYVVDPYRDYPELLEILLRLLKTEMSVSMRRTTMRVLGIIGALDPYTYKVFMGLVPSVTSNSMALSLPSAVVSSDSRDDIVQWFHYERCTLSEFYPTFAIANLMQMLRDDSLHHLHRQIIQALLTIFSNLGPKSSQYVDKVVPKLIDVTQHVSRPDVRQFFLQQLASLISTIGVSMKPYMGKLFGLVADVWSEDVNMKLTVVNVMQQIGSSFGASFAPFVADLCPYLLKVFYSDRSTDRALTCAAFGCVESISMCLAPYVHLILPPILAIIDDGSVKVNVRQYALDTVYNMGTTICLNEHAPRIMQVWLRNISIAALQQKLLHLLVLIVKQMWKQFMVFRASVDHALIRNNLHCDEYFVLMSKLDEGSAASPEKPAAFGISATKATNQSTLSRLEKGQRINVDVLKKTWTVVQLVSKEDWDQWLLLLRLQFIRQSPSAALRACAPLADMHQPLAKNLFNAAFMSVWTDLDEIQQKDLDTNLKVALNSSKHTDIIQTILNLAEFMDHSEKGPLPVGNRVLSKSAEQTRAYAKALRYTELHIRDKLNNNPDAEHCTALITYANKLNVQEVAAGVVALAEKRNIQISMQGRWYEKLNDWEKALEMYEAEKTVNDEVRLHQMHCMEALGQWDDLNKFSKKAFDELTPSSDPERKQKMSIIAARGCWAIGDWDRMEWYVQQINENSQDGSFLRAVVALRKEQYRDALTFVDKVRDMSDAELTAMASESYERAYGAMTLVQQLTELEEAIEYKMWPERRTRIGVVWSRRLQGCRQEIEHWTKLLLVRSLVLSMKEMRPLWIKFSSLCRRQGKLTMSHRILTSLLGLSHHESSNLKLNEVGSLPMDKPSLVLAICKQLWIEKHEHLACTTLETLVMHLDRDKAQMKPGSEMSHLCAKCCLKLGEWYEIIASSRTSQQQLVAIGIPPSANPVMMGVASLMLSSNQQLQSVQPTPVPPTTLNPLSSPTMNSSPTHNQAIKFYSYATNYDPNWYKAWHKLASAYFNSAIYQPKSEMLAPMASSVLGPLAGAASLNFAGAPSQLDMGLVPPVVQQQIAAPPGTPQSTIFYAVQAVTCFVKAITLAEGSRLEDTLRFLTLWFKHGDQAEVFDNIRQSLKILPVEMWLEVIPQLMARLDSKHNVAQLIKQVVIDLSKVHPQSLVYALTVADKSLNKRRSAVAKEILSIMSDYEPVLVEQARLVSDELIRCAILWHEQWHEALDEASRLYFQDKNVKGMFELLEPLHEMVERGAATLKEQSFKQTYDNELKEAWNACRGYLRSQNLKELNQAWDLYYIVFRKISNQLRQLTSLDLNYVSPKLMKAQNLELAVPGTYDPKGPLITIASVGSKLQVISSKQRPRKVTIKGSDGREYAFLLKGHEDPRQDERVMQLFGLVNTLLLHESDTCRRNLTIQRYSIVTLSQNSGLIGWVPNCDTLHSLIRDYREKKNILLSMEHKLMQAFASDLDQLTLMQKVQVFEHALEMTSGNDLQQILWLKSPDSEVWFERRTNYTRSMACMSMVGYILGLGDRHPSNLMLDRINGKIVHIDFGDCFEVAMTREKFPEKIPFRLTRMLIQAMESTGIEGNYRITCERVLRVLRSNKESLLAVLEAFVYDPLINWRLMEAGGKRAPPESQQRDGQRDSRAELSLKRIRHKLCGRDFQPNIQYAVPEQVNRLIDQATSPENLCQCYIGWCPFW